MSSHAPQQPAGEHLSGGRGSAQFHQNPAEASQTKHCQLHVYCLTNITSSLKLPGLIRCREWPHCRVTKPPAQATKLAYAPPGPWARLLEPLRAILVQGARSAGGHWGLMCWAPICRPPSISVGPGPGGCPSAGANLRPIWDVWDGCFEPLRVRRWGWDCTHYA